jgi:hypothetical protein
MGRQDESGSDKSSIEAGAIYDRQTHRQRSKALICNAQSGNDADLSSAFGQMNKSSRL